MKITLEFESYDDAAHHIMGYNYVSSINDFYNWLRNKLKHEDLTESECLIYEEIQKKFFSILEENNVNLD